MQPSFLAGAEMICPESDGLNFHNSANGFHDDEAFSQTVSIDFYARAIVRVFYLRATK
jgi:hypothetical protein